LHEPTAAAVFFTHHLKVAGDIPASIVIGGGKFVVSHNPTSGNAVSVLGIDDDPTLRERDFDLVLAKYGNQHVFDNDGKDRLEV
jgi:molecular chaperone DnaK (HSP70)